MKLSFVVSAKFDEEAPISADTLKWYADAIRDTLDTHDCGQEEDFDVEPFTEADASPKDAQPPQEPHP